MAAAANMKLVSQFMGKLTPAERPLPQSPDAIAVCAKWVVTSEEEHAVSMLTAGPCHATCMFKTKLTKRCII